MTADDHTTNASGGPAAAGHDRVQRYEIRVHGHLGARWASWFDGLSLTAEDDGTTVLRGPVVDQAALHGVLQRLRDLGIPLVSLTRLPPERPTDPATASPTASPTARTAR